MAAGPDPLSGTRKRGKDGEGEKGDGVERPRKASNSTNSKQLNKMDVGRPNMTGRAHIYMAAV